jgi:hypothetical protein
MHELSPVRITLWHGSAPNPCPNGPRWENKVHLIVDMDLAESCEASSPRLNALAGDLARFHDDEARFPDSLPELRGTHARGSHHAPHVDHWGTPFRYARTDAGYALRSAGPDATFGTADDLVRHFDHPARP